VREAEETQRETVAEWAARLGLTLSYEPTGPRKWAGKEDEDGHTNWRHAAHWRVRIERPSGNRTNWISYTKGAAHRRWKGFINLRTSGLFPGHHVRPGGELPSMFARRGLTVAQDEALQSCTEPTPPEVVEVLECLRLDAAGVMFGQTFREWCEEYGYGDTEASPADVHESYEATKENVAQLRQLVGHEELVELVEAEEV